MLNHPDIAAVFGSSGQIDVTYRMDALTTNAAYPLRVHFYLQATGSGLSNPLGNETYSLPPLTQATINLPLPDGVSGGLLRTMVLDAQGNSSELGPAMPFSTIPLPGGIFADGFEG